MQVSAPVFDAYGAVTASLMMARDLCLCGPARCDVVSLRRATPTSNGSGHGWAGRK